MKTINIIETNTTNGVVNSVETFVITEAFEEKQVTKDAEKFFIEKCVNNLGMIEDAYQIDHVLESGYYESKDKNIMLSLMWSQSL